MAVSLWTYLINHPPKLGVCLSNRGYSGKLIRESGEFALNIVGKALQEAALNCGRCSGEKVDKVSEFAIEMSEASEIKADLVADSRVSLECRLTNCFDVGDHTIYVGEIISAHGDEGQTQLYAFDGYSRLDTL